MPSAGQTLSSSLSPRQPFKKKATVHACQTSGEKSGSLKKDMFDLKYRTYPDTDTLSICIAKATPGVISHSLEPVPGIIVDYTETDRVVCIDIDVTMDEMPYHLFDVPDQMDSKNPLVIKPGYDASADKLTLSFDATSAATVTKEIPTADPDISIGVCSSGLWRAIFLRRAHSRLLVPMIGWVD